MALNCYRISMKGRRERWWEGKGKGGQRREGREGKGKQPKGKGVF